MLGLVEPRTDDALEHLRRMALQFCSREDVQFEILIPVAHRTPSSVESIDESFSPLLSSRASLAGLY